MNMSSTILRGGKLGLCSAYLLLLFLLGACSSSDKPSSAELAKFDYDLIYSLPERALDFTSEVQPVLEQRCVVCHGCYDAPCQLKLSSVAGINRGASKEVVYNGARIKAAEPSRLFIDASTTEQWRQRGFYSIFAPNRDAAGPQERLNNSLMYQMLLLKQLHPQPVAGLLPASIDTSLGRSQSCPKLDEFDKYAKKFPLQGMPFAMPNLAHGEYATLVHWIAQGAPMPEDVSPSAGVRPQLEKWERFLNGSGNKQQLVSRYIYEHLFQGHIHFEGSDKREFYRLVRSSTPPGQQLEIINTRRAYGDPEGPAYYRLVRIQGSIVAKDHVVYQWSDARLLRYRQLFLDPEYEVDELPGFEPELAANPIRTFAALPAESRYRFLLDDAKFFIEGFIKGPVCRGQIALNVIEDQFWVVFFDPDAALASKDPDFLNAMGDYLASPSELGDNFKVISARKHYGELHNKYIQARQHHPFTPAAAAPIEEAMDYVWDGDGYNPNAALTIFRHFDSASVDYGFLGDYPETAWVIDYPLLERIHYLLVAGYDVYGNLGHQLNSRLYMDFLRIEGEDYFLSFLPAAQRESIRTSWYSGIRSGMEDARDDTDWFEREYVTGYQTDDPQRELYQYLERHLGSLAGGVDYLNRCDGLDCAEPEYSPQRLRVERAMRRTTEVSGMMIQYLPDVALLRVRMGGDPADDLAYSLISNIAYKTVSSMFQTEKPGDQRDYAFDTQTVLPYIAGSYPDLFYEVDYKDIDEFAERYTTLVNTEQYQQFVARFGVRRTDSRFWETSDWFNQQYRREKPLTAGILDLNRYKNR